MQHGDLPFSFQGESFPLGPDDFVARIGTTPRSKVALLDCLIEQLKLPDYFGRNWDALEECLRDFWWIKARRIVIFHENLPLLEKDALKTYLDILHVSVNSWKPGEEHELVVVFPERCREEVQKQMTP